MIVVKVGGGKDLDVEAIVEDVAHLHAAGKRMILVHGGAETTNEVSEALGHPPQFVTSESGYVSRRTDRRTLEIFEMVYCGQLNKMWVESLQQRGVNAVGLSGLDGRIFEGTRKDKLRVRINGRRMVLREFPNEDSLIAEIPRARANDYMQYAEGRMKKKVMGAVEAIEEGVQRVVFADGRLDRPITKALDGGGTQII